MNQDDMFMKVTCAFMGLMSGCAIISTMCFIQMAFGK